MQPFPHVRPLSPHKISPGENSEQPQYALQDPAQLAGDQLLVSLPVLYLMELADGTRTPHKIASDFDRLTGNTLSSELLESLLARFDQNYLLDNERARERLRQINPRPYRLLGPISPSDRRELSAYLDDLIGADDPSTEDHRARASILPHIDYKRGRNAYRAGYRCLIPKFRQKKSKLTVIILGISHAISRTPFILTNKDFDTPLGLVKTDQELVAELSNGLPFNPYQDEFNHIGEHSIELHAILLRHLVDPACELRIVPILCGSFHQALKQKYSPQKLPGVPEFLNNLKRLRDKHSELHFLASVDLAHMGRNFDQKDMNKVKLDRLAQDDSRTISSIESGKAEDFFASLQADGGIRNYCGTPAIFSLLELFPEPFQLKLYQQCSDSDLSSTVTVCSAIL